MKSWCFCFPDFRPDWSKVKRDEKWCIINRTDDNSTVFNPFTAKGWMPSTYRPDLIYWSFIAHELVYILKPSVRWVNSILLDVRNSKLVLEALVFWKFQSSSHLGSCLRSNSIFWPEFDPINPPGLSSFFRKLPKRFSTHLFSRKAHHLYSGRILSAS